MPGNFQPAIWERGVKSVREFGKVAEDLGITVALEIVNRFETLVQFVQFPVGHCEQVSCRNFHDIKACIFDFLIRNGYSAERLKCFFSEEQPVVLYCNTSFSPEKSSDPERIFRIILFFIIQILCDKFNIFLFLFLYI